MNPLPLYALLAVGGVSLVAIAGFTWARRKTPEQREQERRLRISEHGRITDGTVLDTHEMPESDGQPESQLVIYTYDVSGVTYEASQEVTHLRHLVDLHACRIGLPASIKYDPQNPGNSIVIAEDWSGIRKK